MSGRTSLNNSHLAMVMLLGIGLLSPLPGAANAQSVRSEAEIQTEQMRDAERAREAQRTREAEQARLREDPPVHSIERDRRPGELYVAGFGGYTFGHSIGSPEGLGALSGTQFGGTGIDLKNSGVYGAKVGYFLPDRLNWLGLEMEAFNTTPHIKQHSENAGEPVSEGSHLRVTTLAFNVIARAKMMCERDDERRSDARRVDERDYRPDFCRLQPYVGAGLGVFFARAKDIDGSSSDNAVPGLNALAGVRYFVTRNVAVFGEYKYNRASFSFDSIDNGSPGGQGGFKGTYSASMIVGGLSYHF
jgi:outer membrane protein W